MAKPDGGPAFPVPVYVMTPDQISGPYVRHTGLSLRDYFAAQALALFCSRHVVTNTEIAIVAAWCYSAADALLTEREK